MQRRLPVLLDPGFQNFFKLARTALKLSYKTQNIAGNVNPQSHPYLRKEQYNLTRSRVISHDLA